MPRQYSRRALSLACVPLFLGSGGVASIRRNASSRPIPSSLSSPLGEFGGGLGFDGFPDFVAGDLGTICQALAFDVLENRASALHIIEAQQDAMVPAEIELGGVALQVLFADAVERADQATLEKREA